MLMRRIGAALIAAAVGTIMTLGVASAAQAGNSHNLNFHNDWAACEAAGQAGVAKGDWPSYECVLIDGSWWLRA